MNKKNVIICFLGLYTLLCSKVIFAALPPYYQTAKEMIAILNNPEISNSFGSGRVIYSIIRTENGYTLSAGECTMAIQIEYKPNPTGMVGPALFDVVPGQLECKSK